MAVNTNRLAAFRRVRVELLTRIEALFAEKSDCGGAIVAHPPAALAPAR